MAQALYIFVTSGRPDQYLNSIAHCMLCDGVRRVVFVEIRGFGKGTPSWVEEGISLTASQRVTLLLDSLSNCSYRFFVGERADEVVDLKGIYPEGELEVIKNTYKQILNTRSNWENREINYLDLRNELARIYKNEDDPIFDVTAIRKTYLGDLVSCCILEGIQKLYTFDLKIVPNFDEPWDMLFHKLRAEKYEESLYRYINIVDTPVYKNCSKSVLINTTPVKILLIIGIAVLLALIVFTFYFEHLNWIVQIATITSILASILSLYLIFFPPRRL